MRKLLVFVLNALICLGQTATTPSTGSVRGVVLNVEGKPIPGAIVYGLPEQDMFKQFPTTADAKGEFTLTDLPQEDFYLHAYKESDGYPDSMFAFYRTSEREWIKVHIKAGQEIKDVSIQLGPKTARLNIAVTNETGSPLEKDAELVFTRPDMPGPYKRAMNTTESLAVPAVPFRLTVEAEGYEPWHYGGTNWQTDQGLIKLNSGATLALSVQLRRIN
jgi:hypothetical protein